ncbi:uncharacterized protein LOC111474320 [Cucurbita maxima]|uniref:Uncharacterized protein LOC111474320 n=1 Tax=Cucurbita maxima TaxID=3661 RepID=A0A6J1IIM4_CUCMA|nr:uncharacterized protein LOC111474320 [Cucurbita maxima]
MSLFDVMRGLYKAVIKEEWKNVEEELKEEMKIVFPMTTSKDTALHLAVYSGEEQPLKSLLAAISTVRDDFWRNSAGNTPLHEAATIGNLAAVKLLVDYNKDDLLAENIYGETPMFRAARCGHLDIVEFILEDCDDYLSRSPRNWTTRNNKPIIHAVIQSQKFDVVLKLAEFDKSLLEMKDSEGKTALQVLANMPLAFHSGSSLTFFESFIYTLLPNEDIYNYKPSNFESSKNHASQSLENKKNGDLEAGTNSNGTPNFWIYFVGCLTGLFWRFIFLGWPQWKEMYKKKRHHKLGVTITNKLAQIDNSWRKTKVTPDTTEIDSTGISRSDENEKLDILQIQSIPINNQGEIPDFEYNDHHETPLLLAAANGIIEIVDEIFQANPQAVDYLTVHDRNILHVAIAHRRKNIFDWILKRRLIMARLVNRIDDMGFTALHHVGITKFYSGGTHGPALQLQEELKWYERVQSQIPALYTMHHSKMKWTAREFFEKTHNKLLEDGKEWLKKTSESCSAVAVLISTVVFAAAYTVPGGLNSKTGSPVLLTEPIYIVFTIMDIIGLATALTSLVLFLSVLTSSFKMDDFLHTLPLKLSMGFQLLFLSVATTMMAFALTIVLTMKTEEMKWTVSLLYLATFFPVTMFIIIQMPLYVQLVKNIWGYRHNLSKFFPMGFVALFWNAPSKILTRKFV